MNLFMIVLVILNVISVSYAVITKISAMALLAYLMKEKGVDLDDIRMNEIRKYTSRAARELFRLRS